MIVIGEKINGTLKGVARAILERDTKQVSYLARIQAEAGVDYLDVNGGTSPVRELDDLIWLVQVIQGVVETPLCIDSANHQTLSAVLPLLKRKGIVNSVDGEPDKLERLLPLIKANGCDVIALLMDERGVPETVSARMQVANKIVEFSAQVGIEGDRILFDPLVLPIATKPNAGQIFLETLKCLKQEFPISRTVSGVSNISFGLPLRRLLNRAFLCLVAAAGIDAVILDILDNELLSIVKAARAVAGLDLYCREYLTAYRANKVAVQRG